MKSSLQNILLSDNFDESIYNNVKEGPNTEAFTLSDDLRAWITFSLKDKLLTFLLSPCHGIWRPSILNSEPTLYETVSSILLSNVALKLDVNIPSAAARMINNDILE